MARGRKKLPTVIHLANGNPSKKKFSPDEPMPPAVIPECPKFLDKYAKQEWKSISVQLHEQGLLTSVDGAALALYCQAYARWRRAEEEIQKTDMIMKASTGLLITSPWIGISNKAVDHCLKFLREFGLTPSSRASLTVGKGFSGKGAEKDPFNAFVNNRNKKKQKA